MLEGLRELRQRLLAWLGIRREADDLEQEFAARLEMAAEEFERGGMTSEEARLALGATGGRILKRVSSQAVVPVGVG